MKKHVHIIVFVFVLLIAGCSPNSSPQNSDLDEKIRRVENGLLFTETITARMNYHKVPGVSIAVINDYQVEWAKGYGVLELGGIILHIPNHSGDPDGYGLEKALLDCQDTVPLRADCAGSVNRCFPPARFMGTDVLGIGEVSNI